MKARPTRAFNLPEWREAFPWLIQMERFCYFVYIRNRIYMIVHGQIVQIRYVFIEAVKFIFRYLYSREFFNLLSTPK